MDGETRASSARAIRAMVPLMTSERVRTTDHVMTVLALLGRALQVHGRDVLCEAGGVELATADRAVVPKTRLAILLRRGRDIAVPIPNMTFDARGGDVVELDVAATPQTWDARDRVLGEEWYGLEVRGQWICAGGMAGR